MVCHCRDSKGVVSFRKTSNKTEESVDVSNSDIMYILKHSEQNSRKFRLRFNDLHVCTVHQQYYSFITPN